MPATFQQYAWLQLNPHHRGRLGDRVAAKFGYTSGNGLYRRIRLATTTILMNNSIDQYLKEEGFFDTLKAGWEEFQNAKTAVPA